MRSIGASALAVLILAAPLASQSAGPAAAAAAAAKQSPRCAQAESPRRDPSAAALRCWYGITGPGRFGLAEHMEVPVYQPATPLPGTHVVGVPGLPAPQTGESYEAWEWRVLRSFHGESARQVYSGAELLDPIFASRILQFEQQLREARVRFRRYETWRSPQRQEFLFQYGRSRPGSLRTATLTSWHSAVDAREQPASRAVDYHVPGRDLPRFHEIAWEVGLETFGPESNDPGHVYMPSRDVPPGELVLLRLLPRVPVVTIATGRPVDQFVSRERLAELRQRSLEFASEPFLQPPLARIAGFEPSSIELSGEVAAPEPRKLEKPRRASGLLAALFSRSRR